MSGDLAIQYAKLPEWLLARRLIPEDYARLLPGAEAKVQDALAEEVADAAAKALIAKHREAITYFAARDIYEAILKSPEGQSKTLLGKHTNPAAAKWRGVLDAYRRRRLGWASGARVLIRSASYELPALKRHIAACERQVAECTQRQGELVRAEANARARYADLLRELGIEGLDPWRELRAHAETELPKVRAKAVELLRGSGLELAAYYEAYARHAAGGGSAAGGADSEPSPAVATLPLLRAVVEGGEGARVEKLEHALPALLALRQDAAARRGATEGAAEGAPPGAGGDGAGEMASPAAEPEASQVGGGIDWGIELSGGGGAASEGAVINWDFAVSDEGGGTAADQTADAVSSTGGIDWGMGASVEGPAAAGGIDWSSLSLEGLEVRAHEADPAEHSVEEAASAIIADPSARELLHQEVAEVGAFLQERVAELSPGGAAGQVDGGPLGVDKGLKEVQTLAELTSRVEELLAGRQTQRLLLLHSSERYLRQHVKRVEVAKAQCGRPVTQRAVLDKVKAEQAEEAKRTRAEVERLRQATHSVQKDLEAELSAHFKANVRIVGDIAQL